MVKGQAQVTADLHTMCQFIAPAELPGHDFTLGSGSVFLGRFFFLLGIIFDHFCVPTMVFAMFYSSLFNSLQRNASDPGVSLHWQGKKDSPSLIFLKFCCLTIHL